MTLQGKVAVITSLRGGEPSERAMHRATEIALHSLDSLTATRGT